MKRTLPFAGILLGLLVLGLSLKQCQTILLQKPITICNNVAGIIFGVIILIVSMLLVFIITR